ncbi:MAG: hypothetical protein ACI4RO_05615 [Candidatus Scatosoma sp.]
MVTFRNRLRKKHKRAGFFISCLICTACVGFTAYSLFYAAQTSFAQEIVLDKTFYFLAAEGENAQACLASAYLYGGAGYALEKDGKEYAVYACYADKDKAENAGEALLESGRKTVILPQRCGAVYLRTRAQKAQKNRITGLLCTLDDCAEAISVCIDGAESGAMGQSSLKSAANSVAGVLFSLNKDAPFADSGMRRCAGACARYAEELGEIAKTLVFARDLRRIHAGICDEYIRFASAYAL